VPFVLTLVPRIHPHLTPRLISVFAAVVPVPQSILRLDQAQIPRLCDKLRVFKKSFYVVSPFVPCSSDVSPCRRGVFLQVAFPLIIEKIHLRPPSILLFVCCEFKLTPNFNVQVYTAQTFLSVDLFLVYSIKGFSQEAGSPWTFSRLLIPPPPHPLEVRLSGRSTMGRVFYPCLDTIFFLLFIVGGPSFFKGLRREVSLFVILDLVGHVLTP